MPRRLPTPAKAGPVLDAAGWMEGTVRIVDKNIYIVQGEINTVVGAIKRSARWSTHVRLDEERDPLLHSFSVLKEVLNNVTGKS
ncbi:Golgi-specific brefeldin A-resistance guanine nucleotide exchange factor 1-like [Python bivittatus]|uniref:Golgi-specific brefeldin A-resistance guanine nucleotide exchange factor 1-like n=1 Tax=Python bivittatus TaxID=176946 RepID=A0A9F2RBG6_PYTBI|nr:Golgi-specific brefeldin A-resistance guanine nucleotide exchange factor 1-like [Python bivittatus]